MPYSVLNSLPTDPSHSRVLCVNTRVVQEVEHWVVELDIVLIPDCDDYVETYRMGEFPSRNRAAMTAMWVMSRAKKQMGLSKR